jgi:protein involved in polysaccharide export with SLBB domain
MKCGNNSRIPAAAAALSLFLVFAGCGHEQSGSAPRRVRPEFPGSELELLERRAGEPGGQEAEQPARVTASNDYTLTPGDVVDVKFFYTPELNETQPVRPDGRISLQMAGEVTAAGKTPARLREELTALYSRQLKNPEIAVVVRSFTNRRVFVGGQVMLPGVIEMPDKMTALEAVMQAGGFDFREAEAGSVVVIRHRDDTRYGYLLDMKPSLKGREAPPFYLEPQDIIFVPRTKIAKVNQWVDQHINKLIPQTGFFIGHTRGRTTLGLDTSAR